jgi:hypothetical protein
VQNVAKCHKQALAAVVMFDGPIYTIIEGAQKTCIDNNGFGCGRLFSRDESGNLAMLTELWLSSQAR